jgi:hypothetical protein
MRRLCVLAVLLSAPVPLLAAPPTVDVPAVIPAVGDYVTLSPKTDAKAITYLGLSGVEPFPSAFLKDPKAFVLPVRGLAAGKYTFAGVASLNDEHTKFQFVVVVGTPPDPPKPPDPPQPPDPPKPPPDGPLRVIFVYESSAPMTTTQQAVMFGAKVREYLDAKAKGWRRFDKDVDATNEKDAEIKALWGAAKGHITTVPCVVVGRGSDVKIIPLPATEDEALKVFAKYAEGGK